MTPSWCVCDCLGVGEGSESGSVFRGRGDQLQPRSRDSGGVAGRPGVASTGAETAEDRRQLEQAVQPGPDRLRGDSPRGVRARGGLRRGHVRRGRAGTSQRVRRTARQQLNTHTPTLGHPQRHEYAATSFALLLRDAISAEKN